MSKGFLHRLAACLFVVSATWPTHAQKEKAVVSKEAIDPVSKREVQCDLPAARHLKNKTSPRGEGCCTYASADMAADYHNFKPMIGVLNDRLGGGTPSTMDAAFRRRAPGFKEYVQATSTETEKILDWAMQTNRIACVTYGYGERYGSRIAHMVNLLHLDPPGPGARACILDNNFPGTWEWMSRDEFFRRHRSGMAWAMVYLLPPPPPVPTN